MSVSLTGYWQQFVDRLIESGRYNNQSESDPRGLASFGGTRIGRSLERIRTGLFRRAVREPGDQTIKRAILRQKSFRNRR